MKAERILEIYKDCSTLITEKTQEIHQLILGVGNENAHIMFIGDVPSSEEEELGCPFSGKAGVQLDFFLEKLGISRDEVYLTHVVKYHPYKVNARSGRISSRAVKKEEINFFLSYLKEEINIIGPKIIVTLGELPFKGLMEDQALKLSIEHGKVRKKYINDRAYKIFPLFHPSFLKNEETSHMEDDMEVLKKLIDYVGDDAGEDQVKTEEANYVITPKRVEMKEVQKEYNEEAASKKGNKMKAIIVYGGEGYADDPTLVAIDRISHVLTELNTRIIRFDLFKKDYNIQNFFAELAQARTVILATTVEWFGIGGHMQMFLDQCWKYGNKKIFHNVYLFGVVISKQSFERDTYNHMIKSWELLGGVEGTSLCANIQKSIDLETNRALLTAIDKKTEEFYRLAHQNRAILPTSMRQNRVFIEVPSNNLDKEEMGAFYKNDEKSNIESKNRLTPDYDVFVEKQQKDIEDITNILKLKLGTTTLQGEKSEPEILKERFNNADENISFKLQWQLNDKKTKNFYIEVKGRKVNTQFGTLPDSTISVNSDYKVLQKFLEGKMTVQKAFMTGEIKAKGDFTILYKLDTLFGVRA